MLPILGPSTIRDAAVLPLDWQADPWNHKEPIRWRNTGIVLRAVDERASILDASNLMEEAALDRYEFIRDGFLQRRDSKIYDTDKLRARRKDKAPGAADEDAPPPNYDEDKDAAPNGSAPAAPATPAPAPQDGAKPGAAAPAAGSALTVQPAETPAAGATLTVQPQDTPAPAPQEPAKKQDDTNSAPSSQK
jgi:phospholipid-binding lipoprotein MlaA